MTFLSRLLGKQDKRDAMRPLWHRSVAIAREKEWYLDCGVADTTEGRFEMVTLVLALVLLRLEREPDRAEEAARLTELFIEDMDGQMRNAGVGDLVVGKHMGKLMGVLGGRLGALRDGLAGNGSLADLFARNVTLREGCGPAPAAARLQALAQRLDAVEASALLTADFAR
ncbi:MAG TPA: ubiquinol-cytochrome C chaperone family protein [Novosphingobium sp.]|nr:ubiquinol-cytochrome C chaperone family protein [Novosphingobium sp.]HMP55607.1 ubiquinol-cytochrome C chaperone family protein [Novosphingobium sp.]